jgi:hypothetical protein
MKWETAADIAARYARRKRRIKPRSVKPRKPACVPWFRFFCPHLNQLPGDKAVTLILRANHACDQLTVEEMFANYHALTRGTRLPTIFPNHP